MGQIGAIPALGKLVPGVNDLATLSPELAREAYGWDPSTVTAGSHKRVQWRCKQGHLWEAAVKGRARKVQPTGCPICSGKKVLNGVNDLQSTHPELAAQAYGWDPATVTRGSHSKKAWWCEKGHPFVSTVKNRVNGFGCGVCTGQQVHPGYNDLATHYPEVAKEAYGWEPSAVTRRSTARLMWQCEKGHTWIATVLNRTPPTSTQCPFCSGRKVLAGFNDLATLFPELAKQVAGWDPRTVTPGCNQRKKWCCEKGHIWNAAVVNRTPPSSEGCPVCAGRKVLAGFNDLATTFPEVAKQAFGWDPSTVTVKSNVYCKWRCEKGHTWSARVADRTPPEGRGCPTCSESGFKPGLPAWFYILQRPGEQQIGVTNEPEVRLRNHSRSGWIEVEVVGPFPGEQVVELERKLKKWLRREVGLVPGTHENWYTARMEVRSLAELKAKSGVETDLF